MICMGFVFLPRPLTSASRLASILISAWASITASCSTSTCTQQQQWRRRRRQACGFTGGRGLSVDLSHTTAVLAARITSTHGDVRRPQPCSQASNVRRAQIICWCLTSTAHQHKNMVTFVVRILCEELQISIVVMYLVFWLISLTHTHQVIVTLRKNCMTLCWKLKYPPFRRRYLIRPLETCQHFQSKMIFPRLS